jgi:ParB family chromosome partitioning protein
MVVIPDGGMMRAAQRLGEKTKDIEASEPGSPKGVDPFRPRTAPGGALAFQTAMRDKQAEIERLQRELEEARANRSSVELPLDRLTEIPGRRRFLSEEQKIELRENLRHNKLVHPIVVRPRPDGMFEIVSGHNRVDQYRELGRETIRAVAEESTDDEAAAGAFFANLMQSDLTDYEKYVGFKEMLSRHPGWTQSQVSEQSGVSKGHISALMAFERLPAEALAIVQARQTILGATAALDLALLTEQGKGARVVSAIKQLAEGKLDQGQAVKFAKATDSTPKAPTATQSFKVKSGKSTWCDVRMTKNVMRIEFTSEDVAQSVREAIQQHLQALAADAKN